ncbi:hypothetical protein BO83DRAFT_32644 [Aspergillus eucalypticola CBS 122712]|uniref:Uncharacterized protein n=1 Tax=Aspergillus eucalypticola (strain CBS 122712 / IBT 29274) TaxID=1448314 RepID=A0A317VIY1_ASPEC|nr:uncharacterized protein BO83DRAFT_32644 [Aspergillus eucalypticola CBS 122712]PWY73369.1 hypothetical protein BO83DRAFT_32644 [Aspergillus eucalypticola CBS 122712]
MESEEAGEAGLDGVLYRIGSGHTGIGHEWSHDLKVIAVEPETHSVYGRIRLTLNIGWAEILMIYS